MDSKCPRAEFSTYSQSPYVGNPHCRSRSEGWPSKIKPIITTATKIELIRRLKACGLATIEATSFVSPEWIPQLADGAQVLGGIQDIIQDADDKNSYPVLVPNMRSLKNAIKSGAREVAVFVSASEGFSKRNINCTLEESFQRAENVVETALASKIRVRG